MDDIIEAATKAIEAELAREEMVLADLLNLSMIMRDLRRDAAEKSARAAIAAIMPAIRERMASIADEHVATGYMSDRERSYCHDHGDEIAEKLRALANTMAAEVGK